MMNIKILSITCMLGGAILAVTGCATGGGDPTNRTNLHSVMHFLLTETSDPSGAIIGFFFIGIAILCYFLPVICAGMRGHHNALAIGILNVFLGWTFLGWIIALVWAFTQSQRPV
jgi:hypothetical protein